MIFKLIAQAFAPTPTPWMFRQRDIQTNRNVLNNRQRKGCIGTNKGYRSGLPMRIKRSYK